MITTTISANGLKLYCTQHDRLSQQQLRFLFVYTLDFKTLRALKYVQTLNSPGLYLPRSFAVQWVEGTSRCPRSLWSKAHAVLWKIILHWRSHFELPGSNFSLSVIASFPPVLLMFHVSRRRLQLQATRQSSLPRGSCLKSSPIPRSRSSTTEIFGVKLAYHDDCGDIYWSPFRL